MSSPRPPHRAAVALALLGCLACAPPTVAPAQVMALVQVQSGRYEPRQVELRTVTDVVAMKGTIAQLRGGAEIVIDPADPLLQVSTDTLSDAQIFDVLVKSKGLDPRASYIDKTGVLWPADFDTWNLVTAYFNFEKSFEYFQSVLGGAPADDLLNSTVFYFPEFKIGARRAPALRDNALFFSVIQSFVLLPFDQLQYVPFAMNQGVIGHEFSHRVFNQRVFSGARLPSPLAVDLSAGALANVVKSLDEGLADFHGYGVTCGGPYGCNARFMEPSVGEGPAALRDFTRDDLCMDATLLSSLLQTPADTFSTAGLQYQVGTLVASALYHAGTQAGGLDGLQRAILTAYTDPNSDTPGLAQILGGPALPDGNIALPLALNSLVQHATEPTLQKALCAQFANRLQLGCTTFPCEQLPACPADVTPLTRCPDIYAPAQP